MPDPLRRDAVNDWYLDKHQLPAKDLPFRLAQIITCTFESSAFAIAATNSHVFSAWECGGHLPSAKLRGVFAARDACGKDYGWDITQPERNGRDVAAPRVSFSVEGGTCAGWSDNPGHVKIQVVFLPREGVL